MLKINSLRETVEPQKLEEPAPVVEKPLVDFHNRPIEQQSPVPEQKPTTLWGRIRKIKNIEIYAAGLVVLVMILIYVSSFMGGGSAPDTANQIQRNNNAFAQEKEARLVATLSQVRGAGNVSAMVTVVGSATLEIAHNIDERTVTQSGPNGTSNTTTTVTKTPVVVNGSPVVVMEVKPRVTGVVVVASGAHDISVRLQLLRAVQALLGDTTANIEILSGV